MPFLKWMFPARHDSDSLNQPEAMNAYDYNIEKCRLKSFKKWHVPFIDKRELALLGFYYYGPSDMVKCHFCKVELGMWEEGDDVLEEHIRWSPRCDLIRHSTSHNVPLNEETLLNALPPAPQTDVRLAPDVSEQECADSEHEYPEYACDVKRLNSYRFWSQSHAQKPLDLSAAGFICASSLNMNSSQDSDKVICFSCNGGLKDWEEDDDPWEQHAMWFGKCEYLKKMRSEEFISRMAQQREDICKRSNVSSGVEVSPRTEEPKSVLTNLCNICCEDEANMALDPCGHTLCGKCISKITSLSPICPMCRTAYKKKIRIFFT